MLLFVKLIDESGKLIVGRVTEENEVQVVLNDTILIYEDEYSVCSGNAKMILLNATFSFAKEMIDIYELRECEYMHYYDKATQTYNRDTLRRISQDVDGFLDNPEVYEIGNFTEEFKYKCHLYGEVTDSYLILFRKEKYIVLKSKDNTRYTLHCRTLGHIAKNFNMSEDELLRRYIIED